MYPSWYSVHSATLAFNLCRCILNCFARISHLISSLLKESSELNFSTQLHSVFIPISSKTFFLLIVA